MPRKNCWETKACGREPGGGRVAEFGVCPAAAETRTHGMNGGRNGGRVCWAIAGTLCGDRVQGSFATKLANCKACPFYEAVRVEEGAALARSREVLVRLASG